MSFLCACFWSPQPKIPEEYLRPQGLYSLERVDLKKLKRLIRNQQLAPCHPGVEEPGPGQDLEECPICFLHYPILNSSLCCHKRVCTECFLQVQTSTAPHQLSSCPFCKVMRPTGYLVKLIGARTAEEKEQERVEEQKVIEARIREREEEMRRDQERVMQRQQQQQQQVASAPAAGSRANNNGSNAAQQQQQPSAGVIAAAAAAASSLEPSGAVAGQGVAGRAAGRAGAAAAAAAAAGAPEALAAGSGGGGGGHGHGGHAGRYQSGERHRSAAAAAVSTPATVVQAGGGGGGGLGVGLYPTASARRAAAAAAMSAAIQQHQQQQHQQFNHHHHHHQEDRYIVAPEAGAGGAPQPEAPDHGAAAAYGGGGGGHQRRQQGGVGRRYRLTDYVPAGVVDIAMGLDDINDLMLEQAMYESLVDAAVASPPPTQPATASTGVAAVGGGGERAGADAVGNNAALAAALAASLGGGGDTDSPVAEGVTLPHALSPRTSAAAAAASGPRGWTGSDWRRASGQPAALAHQVVGSGGGGGGAVSRTTANRSSHGVLLPAASPPPARGAHTAAAAAESSPAAAAMTRSTALAQPPSSPQDSRTQSQPQRRSPVAVAVAAGPRRDGRPAAPSPRPEGRGPSSEATDAARGRRDACADDGGKDDEGEVEESLVSRRTAAAPATEPGAAPAVAGGSANNDAEAAVSVPKLAAVADAAAVPQARLTPDTRSPGGSPAAARRPGNGTLPDMQANVGAAVESQTAVGGGGGTAAAGARQSSFGGGFTPTTLSPVPSDGPVGTLLDAVGGVSGGGAAGEQHLTNPLYDIWSNSSSATTNGLCKNGSVDAPGLVASTAAAAGVMPAAGNEEEAAATAGRPGAAASSRWGVMGGSERSFTGSDIGIVLQHSGSRDSPASTAPKPQHQQHRREPSLPAASDASNAAPVRSLPLRPPQPPPPPPLAVEAQAASPAISPVPTPGGVAITPSPRLGLPPLGISPPAAAPSAALPLSEAAPAGGATAVQAQAQAEADAGASTTTVVTIQTLAAELLRHGSGTLPAAAVAAASGDGSHIVTVGMVFQVPSSSGAAGVAAASGSRGLQPATSAKPPQGPAWVENPDGSLQVLLPSAAAASAAAATPASRYRRPNGGYVASSDDVMEVPYMDYELPELAPIPSLGPPTGLDLPAAAPYIANGGNEPAPIAIGGLDPAEEAAAEAADEALLRRCDQADQQLRRLVAAEDAAVAAAIAAVDRASRIGGVGTGADGDGLPARGAGAR